MDEDASIDIATADDEFDLMDALGSEEVKNAIKLVDVTRTYSLGDREIVAVDEINLQVEPGEFVVVEGPSGSGKTTLLNMIGAIDYPTSGRVLVMDVPIGDYDEHFRALFRLTNTGFIFQSYNLISTLTALENVMFPMQLFEDADLKPEEEAHRLLDRVGLAERTDHLPWQLSSGEQQRVAIARAMSNDPPLILADEPTANLDVDSAQMIREILRWLNDSGKTVLCMTHDINIIEQDRVRVLTMKNGVIGENV
ncbi:ABC transporter ATP-binding protein [Candidatus Thorarchaeota archaeon]|nr:MAG: ABC transporter ATP-binding protein [Candidatus Thorarchaeota archaeon]